ncbi:zinc-dependent metalloprotease [Sphingomonas sp. 3-13AW]|jgi:hypothetical protein|uniref:zinc-dependent metalloprotease n=1 Tax=Sphingomonas sp. 3-13AW TaxID=3050450 RepID=UPI003BB4A666
MSKRRRAGLFAAIAVSTLACASAASAQPAPPGVETVRTGPPVLFAPMGTAKDGQRVLLPPAAADGTIARYLYTPSIAGGLGSVELGMDRARLGETQILAFRKIGSRVIAEFENTRFQAMDAGPGEREAVRRSFSNSPIWSGEILQEDARGVVVDLSGLLMRDALDVAGRLKRAKAGSFKLSTALSYLDPEQTLAFPDNVEFEAALTFTSDEPARVMDRVLPDGHALTVRVHHSFIRLPGAGFRTRAHDPRAGTSVQVIRYDFAAPLDQPMVTRLARRFRLEKRDPAAARSPVKKPIIFHVDRAAPEMIRTALMEGAQWWSAAFHDAGFADAFRVEVLPEGVNPMDARYNVIAWVHSETRGWSTGTTIVDPRTGEIVRGVVQLGSLRAWHDKLIFQALAGTSGEGTGRADDPLVLVRARLRQLAVHEVGHALGMSHNFAGSTFADRASVMDYPAPRIRARGEELDFTDAYATGVGAWDRFAIDWLYREFPVGTDERAQLDARVREAQSQGYRFVADGDTRGEGDAQPWGNMWDDGPDAVASLAETLRVRRIALDRFGIETLRPGAPAADLQRLLVPLYLFHRYQVVAASKLIAGLDYRYAVIGDGGEAATPIPAGRQRAALDAVLGTLRPEVLDLPDALIPLLSSKQSGTPDRQFDIELLPGRTAAAFDWAQAAEVAADVSLAALLAPERINRLVLQGAADPGQLSASALFDALEATLFAPATGGPRAAEIVRQVRARYLARLLSLSEGKALSPSALASVQASLRRFGSRVGKCRGDRAEQEHCALLATVIAASPEDRARLIEPIAPPPPIPPGAPIGSDTDCWFCEGPGLFSQEPFR